jgi:YggT family protein
MQERLLQYKGKERMTGFLGTFLQLLTQILYFAIFARIILSWVDPASQNRVSQILHEITEPVLGPIRRIMPNTGMLDLSPMVAIFLLVLLQNLIRSALGGR